MNEWQPLTESSYCILLALVTPNHGYGIMQDVEQFSNGSVQVGAGTLYTALSKFEKRGVIERLPDQGRQKRYQLTEAGQMLLQSEIERMATLVKAGKRLTRQVSSANDEEQT
ncbi:MAG: PadR family transcriptional regulator [Pseudomonadota bacterium]